MPLIHHLLGVSIDRRGRGIDQLVHPGFHGVLYGLKYPADIDVEGCMRILGAITQGNRGEVEYPVDAGQ